MDITVQKAISATRDLEKQLSTQLSASNVSYTQLEETLKEICQACTTALLQDFESASAQHAESRLWDSHQKVNSFYRAELQKLKKSTEPNTVARRKLEGSYLKSIKTAQRFYRGFIHSLASVYGGIPELERIARKVPFDGKVKPAPTQQRINPKHILTACHSTLIHLGDLSRYREAELAEEKDWRPAVGFYDLAISVLPSSGISYNQLAVIALADGNLFRATYQLYRALSTEEPHPQAEANLRRAFFKITNAWRIGELKTNHAMTAGAGLPAPMVAWYLRVLSLYFHGKAFPERDEMENEVITQLKVDLRKRPTEGPPHRFVKINIAAGYSAQERLLKAESNTEDLMQSYLFFLRLNIRTFVALLDVFQEALDGLELGKVTNASVDSKILSQRITPIMARILPVLRLYSLWLRKNSTVLAQGLDSSFATIQEGMWTAYARCLSSIIQVFPSEHLSSLEYLLKEDEDTLGFKPLHCQENSEVWNVNDIIKPRWHEISGKTRDANAEMLSRITGLVVVALKLAMDPISPVVLDQTTYAFRYEPATSAAATTTDLAQAKPNPLPMTSSSVPQASSRLQDLNAKAGVDVDDALNSDFDAQRMVDSIVGIEDLAAQLSDDTQRMATMDVGLSGVDTSPFPVGTHTANDLIAAVRNYSQTRKSGIVKGSVPMFPGLGLHSPHSSGIASPAFGPRSFPSPNPALAFPAQSPDASHAELKPRPNGTPRAPPGLSHHSRMNSNDSNTSAVFPDATWSSYQPTETPGAASKHPHRRSLYNDRGLGNGTFGDLTYRRESDSRGGSAMGSPAITTPKNDVWGRASGGFGSTTPLFETGPSAPWSAPGWNVQPAAWGNPTVTTTSRNASRDFTFTRPVT